jgi:predicted branched-subunit amino acid permease
LVAEIYSIIFASQAPNPVFFVTSRKSDILAGLKLFMPLLIATAPFGLLFGAVAAEKGLSTIEVMTMSAFLFAGASQFVALDLWGYPMAYGSIILSVFAVNFRHVLYSASLGRKMDNFNGWQKAAAFALMVDPQWAAAEVRAEEQKDKGGLRPAFYFALAIPLYIWLVFNTWMGSVFGSLISNPEALGFDMILPIYFLGLTMGFRKRNNWLAVVLASGVVSIIVYLTIGSPWHISLGGLAGIAIAAMIGKPKSLLKVKRAPVERSDSQDFDHQSKSHVGQSPSQDLDHKKEPADER